MIDELLEQIEQQRDVRAALSRLRAEIKDTENKKVLQAKMGQGEWLEAFLASEDAKVRKNAAALIGDLGIKEMADALFFAYQRETTLFVRGTLLDALAKTNPVPYLDELRERYEFLCGSQPQENEKKHIREEIRVLERILREEKDVSHTFTGWDKKFTVLLTTEPGYGYLTAEQVNAKRKKVSAAGVYAAAQRIQDVADIRTWRELLFPIRLARTVSFDEGPEIFGEAAAASCILSMLEDCHGEGAPFYFRIELRGGLSLEERSRYVKRAAAEIEEKSGRQLINAPDHYEFEIRILLDKEKKLYVFLKMFTIPDRRFSYRREAISTSMHPARAATLLELAKPYLKERAQILDPCCGVGTMLVERHHMLPAREIYGIDTFGDAIEKARINIARARMRVNFIHRDYTQFHHGYLFDEIIADMPAGGRLEREEQDLFYERFFDKSMELLAPGGVLILYTDENRLVKKQIRLHPGFLLHEEFQIQKKEPTYLFVIGTKH